MAIEMLPAMERTRVWMHTLHVASRTEKGLVEELEWRQHFMWSV